MFENLLHQDRVRDTLQRDLESGSMPRSLLFTGPVHSGRLTAALELARGLSCSGSGAPWSCRCPRCTQHRLLDSPYLLMMGGRYFVDEIRAAAAMLERRSELPLFYLFHRNVKKLIRRFDPVLWQDDEKKLARAATLIEKLEEVIEGSHPELPEPRVPDGGKVVELASQIQKLLPADGISINMIRRATFWAHTADSSVNKTVIIENAHEMNDAARNAFLKILEEPPGSVYFILVTQRPGAILPTIRSRLRTYRFASRGRAENRDVISRIYREENAQDYSSIRAFFIDRAPGGLESRRKEIELMFELLNTGSIGARDELAAILGSDRNALTEIIGLCLDEIRESGMHSEEFYAIQQKLEDIHFRSEIYNIPVASALEVGYI
jgi:DNA polymerase-3 subunit gamma/tau